MIKDRLGCTMTMILPRAQVFSLAPSLGLTVAVADLGVLSPGNAPENPRPDLSAVPCPDSEWLGVEPLTADGQAFLQLVEEVRRAS